MLQNLKVFQKHYDFLLWLQTVVANIPISARFTLAQRLENSALAVMEGIIEANGGEKNALKKASLELDKVRIFTRLAKDLRFIDLKKYENAAVQIDEIGRMLGGWIKSGDEITNAQKAELFGGGAEAPYHGFGGTVEGEGKLA